MNNTMRNRIGDIEFEVRARLGIIETYQTGWSKELNIISWNGGVPKYDIRDWNPDHSQMSKGITLHEAEAQKLREMLDARFSRPAVKGRGWDTAPGAEAVEREKQEALAHLQAAQAAQAEETARIMQQVTEAEATAGIMQQATQAEALADEPCGEPADYRTFADDERSEEEVCEADNQELREESQCEQTQGSVA